MVVPRSVTKLLETQHARLSGVKSAASDKAADIVKRALAVQNSLAGVREPIKKRAETEQRNSQWLDTETRNAFAEKVRDLARLRFDINQLKSNLSTSKPGLPPIDRTDFLGAMEVIAVAQRVAASKNYQEISPAERLAALRVPTLAKLPPSIVEHWTNEAITAADPDRMATYQQDQEVIREAQSAVDIVKHSLQHELGFIDRVTGVPSPAYGAFEREAEKPIRQELDKAQKLAAHGRALDAVDAAKKALSEAEAKQKRDEIAFLRAAS
jgi:hypothetical protein